MNQVADYRKKVLACWQGKNIGGTLGAPFEGFPFVNHLTYYDPVPTGALPNDDLELQAMYVAALDRMDKPEIHREMLADIWLKHMNFHCDEYAVAMHNLAMGIRPPWSGAYNNYYTGGMGAAIRSELWACLAPGKPDLAVKFAREDACIDHAGCGIDAEVFCAALEALEKAHSGLQARFSPALNRRAGELLAQLTGGKYDKVSLTREFDALAEEHDALLPRRALVLSRGTADQLYLAVRLAVCELVLPGEEPCPLVLDDALANFDDERMALALSTLTELGKERQILLFTCHNREAAWQRSMEG